MHEYKTATNLTEQFASLAAIALNPSETREEVLADFYSKWEHDFLVISSYPFSNSLVKNAPATLFLGERMNGHCSNKKRVQIYL